MGLFDRDNGKSPFLPVTDAGEQRALLDEAVRQKTPVTLWTRKKEHILEKSRMLSFDPTVGITLEASQRGATKKLSQFLQTQSPACFLNYGILRCGVFFSTIFTKEISSGKHLLLEFEFPKEFFKVQRRATSRLPVRNPFLLLMEFKPSGYQQFIQRKVLDIGAGGLAILTTLQDAAYFSKGQSFTEVRFTVRNRTITVEAEVRHTRMVNEERLPQLLVGLMFTRIDKKDQKVLDEFVSDEMQSQFAALTPPMTKV